MCICFKAKALKDLGDSVFDNHDSLKYLFCFCGFFFILQLADGLFLSLSLSRTRLYFHCLRGDDNVITGL